MNENMIEIGLFHTEDRVGEAIGKWITLKCCGRRL